MPCVRTDGGAAVRWVGRVPGIAANPALGFAFDLLVAPGGIARHWRFAGNTRNLRCRTPADPTRSDRKTGDKLVGLIRWWEDYTARNNGSMDNNPSPGNKKGGLTTILEKSPGAGQRWQIAGGCNIAVFATGCGLAFGSKPSPTIKVATNSDMYNRMIGVMLGGGMTVVEKGRDYWSRVGRIGRRYIAFALAHFGIDPPSDGGMA